MQLKKYNNKSIGDFMLKYIIIILCFFSFTFAQEEQEENQDQVEKELFLHLKRAGLSDPGRPHAGHEREVIRIF